MSDWNPNLGEADIEMTINGVEAEYTIYYDYTYHAGRPAKLYALPEDCCPEEPEEHYFEDLQYETVDGRMVDMPEKEEEFAVGVLLERVGEL